MATPSNSELLVAVACTSIILSIIVKRRRKRRATKKRTIWVRKWIEKRGRLGAFHALQKELEDHDTGSFRNFLRMDKETFTQLFNMVSPFIRKKDTVMRESISPEERLALTLRYLASGNSYEDLSYLYRVPKTTLSNIIPETCAAIFDSLSEKYMKVPNSEEEWKEKAKAFEDRWNFPNCLGALDGKHVCLRHPIGSGAAFYNYKQTFSIVLMALVDADYKFTYIDVGCNGRISDGGVFRECTLYEALENNRLGIPDPKPLPGRETDVPYVIVGDEAFPLKPYLMKPYPQRALNDEL